MESLNAQIQIGMEGPDAEQKPLLADAHDKEQHLAQFNRHQDFALLFRSLRCLAIQGMVGQILPQFNPFHGICPPQF